MILEQVNGRDLRSFPASAVFQFRVTEAGTLNKITFDAQDVLDEDCTFDVNLGATVSDLASIYSDPGDRPVILDGEYTIESIVDVEVAAGDLISVDIDSFAGSSLQLLTVRMEIETAEGGGASSLDDLSDVDTMTDAPATGNILIFDGTNWVPSTASGFSLSDILADDFDDGTVDTGKWNTVPSGVTESGGNLVITVPSSNTIRLRTKDIQPFFDSVLTVKVVTAPGASDTDTALYMSANPSPSFSRYYGISVYGTTLRAIWNGSIVKSFTYNSAVHVYWKIICFAGQITFQYSANGTDWVTFGTAPFGYGTDSDDLAGMYVYLSAYTLSGSTQVIEFDNFSLKRIIQPF